MAEMSESEDGRLIAQVRAGNLRAFEALYQKHKSQVFRTALAITRDRQAAEDILQECFLRVHAHLDRLDGNRALTPWLYRVTVNLSYNWISKGKRQLSFLDEVFERFVLPRSSSLQKHVERSELKQTINDALDSLTFDHRVVVVLFYLNDFSLDEIAYILDCPIGTVKSRLYYAREKLRGRLTLTDLAKGELVL